MLYLILATFIFIVTICAMTLVFGKGSFFQALPFCIILLNGIQCIVFGVLSLVNIGFNGIVSLLINACVCGGCLVLSFRNARKRTLPGNNAWVRVGHGFAKSFKNMKDFVATLAILLFALACMLQHFGPELSLAFISGDSASHFNSMLSAANGGIVKGQFVFSVSGACMIDAVSQVIDAAYIQKCYILNEMLWCWLSSQMLYSILRQIAKGLNVIIAIFLCMLYMGGYPFYSVVMGFGYFGASISVVGALLYTVFVIKVYRMRWIVSLSILLAELAVGYLLFVPPIFFSVFLFLLLERPSKKVSMFPWIGTCIAALAVPCLFAMLLNYNVFFPAGGTDTIGNTISRDGGTFRSLYANFIFIAPLSIYGFVVKGCSRRSFARFGILPLVFICYCVTLLFLAISSFVSPYYFYKTYGVLWLLFFAFAAVGIQQLAKSSPKAFIAYGCIWIVILALSISGVEAKLSERRPDLDPNPVSDSLFPLYRFNLDTSGILIFDDNSFIQLEERENAMSLNGDISVLAGENETRWFSALELEGKMTRWWDYFDHSIILETDSILEPLTETEYVYIDDSFFGRPYQDADYSSLDEVAEYIESNYDRADSTEYGIIYRKR